MKILSEVSVTEFLLELQLLMRTYEDFNIMIPKSWSLHNLYGFRCYPKTTRCVSVFVSHLDEPVLEWMIAEETLLFNLKALRRYENVDPWQEKKS